MRSANTAGAVEACQWVGEMAQSRSSRARSWGARRSRSRLRSCQPPVQPPDRSPHRLLEQVHQFEVVQDGRVGQHVLDRQQFAPARVAQHQIGGVHRSSLEQPLHRFGHRLGSKTLRCRGMPSQAWAVGPPTAQTRSPRASRARARWRNWPGKFWWMQRMLMVLSPGSARCPPSPHRDTPAVCP